jgi:hypothetical protein
MPDWIRMLACQYERTRQQYPGAPLLILFDIDGTILDMRHMIRHVLQAFDRQHGTRFFEHLQATDIDVHENQVERWLEARPLSCPQREWIHQWYTTHRWSPSAIATSHRPFEGVMDVIRWLQLQPHTSVGLNTGRPETLRTATLDSLNALGAPHKVHFPNALLHMNPRNWEEDVAKAKAEAVNHFRAAGYRVCAVIDNEPAHLQALAQVESDSDLLLLHADTLFESSRSLLPPHAVSGEVYDLTALIREPALPQQVELVWHGVNDGANLRHYLAADVPWVEVDVRFDRSETQVILRHDAPATEPGREDENSLLLHEVLPLLAQAKRSLKLDLKEGGALLHRVLDLIDQSPFDDAQLWFNGEPEVITEPGFRTLAQAHPGAILQCPIDPLCPLILHMPQQALPPLEHLRSWGINRLSLSWQLPSLSTLVDQLRSWGFAVNIYGVPNLSSFLQAVLLLPDSITADFNFPQWQYYGRGSGHNGIHHHYGLTNTSHHCNGVGK